MSKIPDFVLDKYIKNNNISFQEPERSISIDDIRKSFIPENNTAYRCNSRTLAIKFLEVCTSKGYKWCNGRVYDGEHNWDKYGVDTCYNTLGGSYGTYDFYSKQKYNIINITK